ncbi:hypothetical protein MTQ28_24275, partial [Escherichia coli]|nr:hypothetical protein [Escherichia coli]
LPSGFSLLHIKEEPAEWRGSQRPAMRVHRMLTKLWRVGDQQLYMVWLPVHLKLLTKTRR